MNNPESTITIYADAYKEVENDFLTITFTATEQSTSPSQIQTTLTEKLAKAVEVVKPATKAGKLEMETVGLSIRPMYNGRGKIEHYVGTVGLTIKGTDTTKISELVGKIPLQVAGTENSVSKKARRSLETELTAEAIEAFKAKADAASAGFGLNKWVPRDIQIRFDAGNNRGYARVMASSASLESAGGGGMAVESGKTSISATVSGNIALFAGQAPRKRSPIPKPIG